MATAPGFVAIRDINPQADTHLLVIPERHVDTFDDCGNLFAAGIPVNLDRAISDGTVNKGDVVMMAAFAHAGDFAGAAAVKWGGRG